MSAEAGEENDPYLLTPQLRRDILFWGYSNHGAYSKRAISYVYRRSLSSGRTVVTSLASYLTSVAVDPHRPDAAILASTDDNVDSPSTTSGQQAIRTVEEPRHTTPSDADLYFP